MQQAGFEQQLTQRMQAGFAALGPGQWTEAQRQFEAVLKIADLPEAREGLGIAAYWLENIPLLFESRECAFRGYRERGDRLGMGRLAASLAVDYMMFRDAEAISSGWLQRGRRQLEGLEPSFEHGLLSGMEGFIAIQFHHDVATAMRASAETLEVARAIQSLDLEILALSMEGLALVRQGQITDGMRRLDEATTAALTGEVSNLDAIVTACCFLIDACEHTRDLTRAAQWCQKMQEFCAEHSYTSMLAYCRTHFANVLLWRGAWEECEAVLSAATEELIVKRAGLAPRGLLALADLRRRQGRFDEAASYYERVAGQPMATLGRALLAFAAGDMLASRDLVDRFLRQFPEDDLIERSYGLVLAVRVYSSLGELDSAISSLTQLEASASQADCLPLRALVSESRGFVAVAVGDLDAARRDFEDAVDLYQHNQAPFETACARIELARVLVELGRHELALDEAQRAGAALHALGASHDATRAETLIETIRKRTPLPITDPTETPGLTRREREVLGLLARGMSNQEIAASLFLSVRTIERHISTVYAKIGANGPAARAVATAFALSHGLASISEG